MTKDDFNFGIKPYSDILAYLFKDEYPDCVVSSEANFDNYKEYGFGRYVIYCHSKSTDRETGFQYNVPIYFKMDEDNVDFIQSAYKQAVFGALFLLTRNQSVVVLHSETKELHVEQNSDGNFKTT